MKRDRFAWNVEEQEGGCHGHGHCSETCTPGRGGVAPLTPEEAGDYLSQTPGWELLEKARLLRCKFKFADFRE